VHYNRDITVCRHGPANATWSDLVPTIAIRELVFFGHLARLTDWAWFYVCANTI